MSDGGVRARSVLSILKWHDFKKYTFHAEYFPNISYTKGVENKHTKFSNPLFGST